MAEAVVRVIDCHMMRPKGGTYEYLVLQRAPGQIYEGVWQGVTGKIKDGETAWQAALRELGEETGLAAEKLWTVDQVNHFYEASADRVNLIPVFGVQVSGGDVHLSDEHSTYRWCSLAEAVELILWGQQKAGLTAFNDMLTRSREKLRWMEIGLKGP